MSLPRKNPVGCRQLTDFPVDIKGGLEDIG